MRKTIISMFLSLAVLCNFAAGCGMAGVSDLETAPAENQAALRDTGKSGEQPQSDGTSETTADGASDSATGGTSGGNAPQNNTTNAASLSEIDKNITATLTITGMYPEYLDDVIRLFNAEFPNVTVKKDVVQLADRSAVGSYKIEQTMLNTKILSGEAGDILMLPKDNSVRLFKQRVLADLHEFIYSDPEFNTDDYFMNIIEAHSFNGGLYVMPLDNTVKMLGFHEPIAAGYDFTDNSDVWESARALETAKDIAAQYGLKGKNYVYGTPDYHFFQYILLPVNYTEFINLETGAVNIDCAEFIDMLKYVKDLADNGYITSTRGGPDSYSTEPENAPIMGEEWFDSMMSECMLTKPFRSSIRPLTGKNGEPVIVGSNQVLSVNEHSPNKRLAWEFIKFAVSYEAQSSPDTHNPPINRAALRVYAENLYKVTKNGMLEWNEEAKEPDFFKPNETEVIEQYVELITGLNEMATKYTYKDSDINDIIREQVIAFFEEKISAEEAAKILQRKVSMVIQG